jgi:predicted ATPase/DNA-binding SARP family transcriptional activator
MCMSETGSESPSSLRISLMGAFDVRIDGSPMERVRSRKERWLLALLVLRHGREVQRDWLAETLWPDSRLDQSRAYLRLSLYLLKQALGSQAGRLQSPDAHSLRLDLTGAEVDVVAFDAAIARRDAAAMHAAVTLYTGPFLEGCTEAWAVEEQRSREQRWLQALEEVADNQREQGHSGEAISLLRRLIRQDPLRESAQRALMEILADSGDYAAVTTLYRDLRIVLRREVNADPSPESVALYERLRDRSQRARPLPPPAEPAHALLRPEAPPESQADDLPPRETVSASVPVFQEPPLLPQPLTPLIGRTALAREIAECLQMARLVTLMGPGGTGKTRLALQAAQEWMQTGEVWFIELAALSKPSFLAQTIAAVCHVAEEPGRSGQESLIQRLSGHRGLLLVLDNCEHLLEACAELTSRLLQACPDLHLLTTSRQALGIAGETLFPVPTLEMPDATLPPEGETEAERLSRLRDFPAIRLFEARAQAVTRTFRVTAGNAEAVLEICRYLDGLPLAIELAAAWISVLTPEQMLARLTDRRFDLLVSRRRDQEARHRSLWATLETSSQLLEPELRRFLACLSVFRGGWTLEAAEAVCLPVLSASAPPGGRALEFLALLQERSLIQTASANGVMRYSLLETVREYAAELLTDTEEAALARAHAACFLALAEQGAPHLVGPEQVRWLDRWEEEQYNLRAVLDWCAQQEAEVETALRLCIASGCFWEIRDHHQEGDIWTTMFLSRDAEMPATLRACAREAAGLFYSGILQSAAARRWSLEALDLYTALGDVQGAARTHCTAAFAEINQMQFDQARTRLEICLPLLEHGEDTYECARALSTLGMLEQYVGAFEKAEALLQRSAENYRMCGHRRGLALTLYRLGGIALVNNRFERARRLFVEASTLSREVKDRITLPFGLFHLGRCCLAQNDLVAAGAYLEEAIAHSRTCRNSVVEATCLVLCADIALREDDDPTAFALYTQAVRIYNRPETEAGTALVASRLAPLALQRGLPIDALRLYAYAFLHRISIRKPALPQAFLLYMSVGYLSIDQDAYEADLAALRRLLPNDFDTLWEATQALSLDDGAAYVCQLAQQLSH